jgi:uncharacterized Ntn-hydrolase superfamily protein
MKSLFLVCLLTLLFQSGLRAQDTFSIVALDSVTGEVGSAGASCVDLNAFGLPAGFLGELFPGVGAINTQASYLAGHQANARARMQAGDTPAQIISWLVANDVQNNPGVRQYGIVGFVNTQPQSAAHTGGNTQNHKGHRLGPNYSIQGNILLGPQILDSMESRFLNTQGTLADKLMAALQGAKVPGADTRCMSNGTSSLFAFLKVSSVTDTFGSPYLNLGVITAAGAQIEPVDSLQNLYSALFPTGTEPEADKSALALFPNPGNDVLKIRAPQGSISAVEIYSMHGKKISAPVSINPTVAVRISILTPGMYLAAITDKRGHRQVLKFVKE